jgi:hypothetical protein
MILDSQTRFSNDQDIFSVGTTVASTDVYDTGAAADVGIGQESELQIQIGANAVVGGTSVQFFLQTADDVGFSTNLTSYPLTAAIAVASLTARAIVYRGRLPIGLRRHIRIAYTSVGTTTAGNANAFLVHDLQAAPALPTTVPGVK